jgi:hypothetical protein
MAVTSTDATGGTGSPGHLFLFANLIKMGLDDTRWM